VAALKRQDALDAVARRHREAADPVAVGRDEIGQAHVGAPSRLAICWRRNGTRAISVVRLILDMVDHTSSPSRGTARMRATPFACQPLLATI
jgi:hypothetical protein